MEPKEMSVREYNELLKKQHGLSEAAERGITVYSEDDFSERTESHWDEFDGLCREPTEEEILAWSMRNGK